MEFKNSTTSPAYKDRKNNLHKSNVGKYNNTFRKRAFWSKTPQRTLITSTQSTSWRAKNISNSAPPLIAIHKKSLQFESPQKENKPKPKSLFTSYDSGFKPITESCESKLKKVSGFQPKITTAFKPEVKPNLSIYRKHEMPTTPDIKRNASDDDEDDICLDNRYKEDVDTTPIKRTNGCRGLNIGATLLKDYSVGKIAKIYNDENQLSCSFASSSLFSPKVNDENKKPETDLKPPHMIGFPNYGNTCYLNAVLQTLLGLESFVTDLSVLEKNSNFCANSLTHSIWSLILAKYKNDEELVQKSLRDMKQSIEKVDGSFYGYKMQDANEFLTQVLDTMKDEVNHTLKEKQFNINNSVSEYNGISSGTEGSVSCTPSNPRASVFDTPSPDSPISSKLFSHPLIQLEYNNNVEDTRRRRPKATKEPHPNPVINNYEFELVESYECLGCHETINKTQSNFALYVNLPENGDDNLQSAVETYMGEDKRELTCEKCKYHTAKVTTRFQQLPRILIVQLKRYEYDPKEQECIKVSSEIEANKWLRLNNLHSENGLKPPKFNPGGPRSLFSATKHRKNNTLKDLESELNKVQVPSTITTPNKLDTIDFDLLSPSKSSTVEPMQTVINISADDVLISESKEDAEMHKAIKLSLQDSNLCFSPEDVVTTTIVSEDKNISEQNTETEIEEENSYRLFSIVSHFGLTTSTGHYVSDVLHPVNGDEWLHYDDDLVSEMQEASIFSEGRRKNGYIFFYVHRDIWKSLKEEDTVPNKTT